MKSRADSFAFKHFEVDQRGASHRLGIDAIALGCWVKLDGPMQVVDCGTGTGILALLAAQRCGAQITGMDVNPSNVACASSNFEASQFSDRLTAIHADWKDFQPEKAVDLVLCNPPYFKGEVGSPTEARHRARQDNADEAVDTLLGRTVHWMSSSGKLSVIYPQQRRTEFMKLALKHGWYRQDEALLTEGKSRTDRFMVTLGRQAKSGVVTEVIPVWQSEGVYHERFRSLTSEAYQKL